MVCLKRASDELFRRSPDETFESMSQLRQHCRQQKDVSTDFWQRPQLLGPQASGDGIWLSLEGGRKARLNDWSFSQTCRLAGVSKETVNRLSFGSVDLNWFPNAFLMLEKAPEFQGLLLLPSLDNASTKRR